MKSPLPLNSACRIGRILVMAVLTILLLAKLGLGSVGSRTFTPNVTDPTVWSLVWSDEFNGPNGSGVDPTKWVLETGGWGWGNNELEYYTNRLQNAHLENGSLVIKALQESSTGLDGTRN